MEMTLALMASVVLRRDVTQDFYHWSIIWHNQQPILSCRALSPSLCSEKVTVLSSCQREEEAVRETTDWSSFGGEEL